jgi:ribose-phosphate pyrophosphokinase
VELATTAVFTGNAHPKLAQDIARCLRLPLAKAQVERFSDGEFNIEILENIRGREVFIIQPT